MPRLIFIEIIQPIERKHICFCSYKVYLIDTKYQIQIITPLNAVKDCISIISQTDYNFHGIIYVEIN